MTTATSANARFDELLEEATAIAERIHRHLADDTFPGGIDWGHVGSMAHYTEALREISDSMFKEGEHAE